MAYQTCFRSVIAIKLNIDFKFLLFNIFINRKNLQNTKHEENMFTEKILDVSSELRFLNCYKVPMFRPILIKVALNCTI